MADGRASGSSRVELYVAAALAGPQRGETGETWLARLTDLWAPLDAAEAQAVAERLRDRGKPASPRALLQARQAAGAETRVAAPPFRHIATGIDPELAAAIGRARDAKRLPVDLMLRRMAGQDEGDAAVSLLRGLGQLAAAISTVRRSLIERTRDGIPDTPIAAAVRSWVAERIPALMAMGIPEDAAEVIACDAVDDAPAVEAVRKWVEQRRHKILVLSGQKDASKTLAASLAVATWPRGHHSAGIRGAWYHTHESPVLVPFALILGPWTHRSTEAEPVDPVTRLTKSRLMTARLLVLDDVGQEPAVTDKQAGSYEEALDQMLEVRSSLGLFTLLTTNFEALRSLLARYPHRRQRIGERLLEHCGRAGWVECPHSGFRRLKTPQRRTTGYDR